MKDTNARAAYRIAWRHCRLLNWGTLNFGYPPRIASHLMDALTFRNAQTFPAWQFKRLGMYARGYKRL